MVSTTLDLLWVLHQSICISSRSISWRGKIKLRCVLDTPLDKIFHSAKSMHRTQPWQYRDVTSEFGLNYSNGEIEYFSLQAWFRRHHLEVMTHNVSIWYKITDIAITYHFCFLGVMIWKRFPHCWPFVRQIQRSPMVQFVDTISPQM